ncbi:MAG: PDZ domain-containing protein [Polyangiales bacterium]
MAVAEVPPHSTAARAGLKVGDRIVAIDDKAVRTLSLKQVVEALRGSPGSWVRLRLYRGQRPLTLRIQRREHVRRKR